MMRLNRGYLKKCGDTAKKDVAKGFALANPKLGNIGITVKIMLRRSELALKIEPRAIEEKKEEAPAEVKGE